MSTASVRFGSFQDETLVKMSDFESDWESRDSWEGEVKTAGSADSGNWMKGRAILAKCFAGNRGKME